MGTHGRVQPRLCQDEQGWELGKSGCGKGSSDGNHSGGAEALAIACFIEEIEHRQRGEGEVDDLLGI